MSNFVDIVGFQLEKVHTGVLKWFLETGTTTGTTTKEKYNAIELLYTYKGKTPPFKEQDIASISCTPEWSSDDSRIRIDLVTEITLNNVSKRVWLVFEVKTDSIPYDEQLKNTRDTFKKPGDYVEYFLLLVGTSMIFERRFDGRYGFKTITNQQLFGIFNHYGRLPIICDWTEALEREISRFNNVEANLKNTPHGNLNTRAYWEGHGYRYRFPLWYCLYEKLRVHLKSRDDWEIESGINNPVMHWVKGWQDNNYNNKNYKTYFEFNDNSYCLKVKIDKKKIGKGKIERDDLNQFRDRMIGKIQKITNIQQGRPSRKSYGTWNTIYKWEFEFTKMNLKNIAGEVNVINNNILPILGGVKCVCP